MRNFAFDTATSVEEAAAAATLACEAMLAPDGGASDPETTIVKAGGIDLLDLMKEGLVAPAKVTSLSDVAGLGAIEPQRRRGFADRRAGHAGAARGERERCASSIRRSPTRPAIPPARKSATRRRSAAICCSGRAAGISAPRNTVACARAAGIATPSPARTAITRFSTTASAPSCIPRLRRRRWSPGRRSGARRRRRRNSTHRAGGFLCRARRTCSARTICVRRDSHRRPVAVRGRHADGAPQAVAERILRLAARRRRRRARPRRRRGLSSRLDRAWRRAPTPHRARAAEALFRQDRRRSSAAAAGRAALEGATPLSQNGFKPTLFEALVRRAVLQAARA